MSTTLDKKTVSTTLDEENVFTLLSNERRRSVVLALQELDPPVDLGNLAEWIAARENKKTVSELTSEERRRVYSALQQRHLDHLEEAGIIERERDLIQPTDRLQELEIHLEVAEDDCLPWAEYYFGLSILTAGMTAAVWAGIAPVTIPEIAWTALIIGAFSVLAVVHAYERRRRVIQPAELPNNL